MILNKFSKLEFKKGDTEFHLSTKENNAIETGVPSEANVALEKTVTKSEVQVVKDAEIDEDKKVSMIKIGFEGSLEELEQFYFQLQETTKDYNERIDNQSLYLSLRYRKGDKESLKQLINLCGEAIANPQALGLLYYRLGICYDFAGVHGKAIEYYELAIGHDSFRKSRSFTLAVSNLAKCQYSIGKHSKAIEVLLKEINKPTNPDNRAELFEALADIFTKDENEESRILALLNVLENNPNDTSSLFGIAYSLEKIGLHHLAILYYKKVVLFDPEHSNGLNNLGVSYDALQLPFHSIQSYKKSFNLQNSLAGANLAFKLISLGFEEEAHNILSKSSDMDEVSPNVDNALETLKTNIANENKKEAMILKASDEQRSFFICYSEAYFTEYKDEIPIEGFWLLTDGTEGTVKQNGNHFELLWSVNEKKRKITGLFTNRAIKIAYYTPGVSYSQTEPPLTKDIDGYGYISEDKNLLRFMTIKGYEHTILEFVRKSS